MNKDGRKGFKTMNTGKQGTKWCSNNNREATTTTGMPCARCEIVTIAGKWQAEWDVDNTSKPTKEQRGNIHGACTSSPHLESC